MNQKGFSLMETMMAVSLSSVVGVLMVQILVQNSYLLSHQTTTITQGLSSNDLDSKLRADLRLAAGAATSYSSYNASSETLILKWPSINAAGDMILNTFDYIVINKDGTNPKWLRRQLFKDPQSSRQNSNTVLVKEVSSVNFSYYDSNENLITTASNYPNAVKIGYTITLLTDLGFGEKQTTVQNTVRLRND